MVKPLEDLEYPKEYEPDMSDSGTSRRVKLKESQPGAKKRKKRKTMQMNAIHKTLTTGIDKASVKLPNIKKLLEVAKDDTYINALASSLIFYECTPVYTDEELCERLNWFFKVCYDHQIYLTFEKMSLAIGYYPSWITEIMDGKRKGFSPRTAEILKKARTIMASADAELAAKGKSQPVVYFFRAKNFYDMQDKKEIHVTNHEEKTVDLDAIEAKYTKIKDL